MKIAALPLEALLAKLSSNNAGFNQALAAIAQDYNIRPFTLAWPATIYSKSTNSVIFGNIPPDELDKFGVTAKNRLVIYVNSSNNQNFEKPRNFSGLVQVALDFHLQWESSNNTQVFEAYSLAVEDAFAQAVQLQAIQNWGAGVIYNGAFSAPRGPVVPPSEGQGSLRQVLGFRLSFEVSV